MGSQSPTLLPFMPDFLFTPELRRGTFRSFSLGCINLQEMSPYPWHTVSPPWTSRSRRTSVLLSQAARRVLGNLTLLANSSMDEGKHPSMTSARSSVSGDFQGCSLTHPSTSCCCAETKPQLGLLGVVREPPPSKHTAPSGCCQCLLLAGKLLS